MSTAPALRCRWVQTRIPEHVMSDRHLSAGSRRHLARCLACQAEVAKYRAIARTLRSLRDERIQAPAGLVFRVMAGLSRPQPKPSRLVERIAVVVSVVVVAVAMALLGRRRLRPAN